MSEPKAGHERLGPLLRTFVGLKVNKVSPWLAVRIVYGWNRGGERWRTWRDVRNDGSGAA